MARLYQTLAPKRMVLAKYELGHVSESMIITKENLLDPYDPDIFEMQLYYSVAKSEALPSESMTRIITKFGDYNREYTTHAIISYELFTNKVKSTSHTNISIISSYV